jgi:hypothetical protein
VPPWRRSEPRGLRRGEELLVEVPCRIVDSTGTSLPDAGTAVVVGVSDERILVWAVARVPTQTGKLLGVVGRSRLLRAEIEQGGARTRVRFGFEEEACLFVEAPRERHLEQLAWVLSADQGRVGQ